VSESGEVARTLLALPRSGAAAMATPPMTPPTPPSPPQFTFLYENTKLQDDDTPSSLGMANGAQVDVKAAADGGAGGGGRRGSLQ